LPESGGNEAEEQMRACSLWIVLIVALTVSAFSQDDSSHVSSKIVAMEKAWHQAFKLRDTKAIDALLDDDIVLVNDDGSLQSKAIFLKIVRDSKSSEEEQVTPESINVRVVGDVAIATGVFSSKGAQNGKPFVRHDRFVDTWIKRGNGWVCASASATPMAH
jgi:ketosteroid isomerase-like protein